jgi:hypothetical protein
MKHGGALLFFVAMLLEIPAHAGGACSKVEIIEFQSEGPDEYRMVLHDIGGSLGDPYLGKPFVVHLRHDEEIVGQDTDVVSRPMYLKAILLLQSQMQASQHIQLCILSNGFDPIEGRPGEYQSNSATIIEENLVALIPHRI